MALPQYVKAFFQDPFQSNCSYKLYHENEVISEGVDAVASGSTSLSMIVPDKTSLSNEYRLKIVDESANIIEAKLTSYDGCGGIVIVGNVDITDPRQEKKADFNSTANQAKAQFKL